MAGTNVQALGYNFITARLSASGNSSNQDVNNESFDSVMEKTSKKSFEVADKADNVNGGKTIDSEVEKNRKFAKKLKETDDGTDEAVLEQAETGAMVQEAVEELKEAIADKLGISAEELDSIMESMNMQDSGLFDANTIGKLFVEVNGIAGPEDMLVNAEMTSAFKDIVSQMETIKAALKEQGIDVTPEGFVNAETGMTVDAVNNYEAAEDVQFAEPLHQTENVKADSQAEETMVSADTVKTSVSAENSENQTGDEGYSPEKSMSETSGQEQKVKNASTENTNRFEAAVSQVSLNPIENLEQVLAEKVGTNQTESILSQLIEQLKVSVNSEFTSMEMQLYPEHLGKVGVQIVARDGAITAQISAETEAVKKVLEAQISTLKENLNNQGLKVENVEVTIASHNSQHNNENNSDGKTDNRKSGKNKKVASSLLDEINGVSSGNMEEQEMMKTLGNTVSYSA